MSTESATDGGAENSFSPWEVTTEAEVAEALRPPFARDADKVLEVLEATGAVAIKLPSAWWGNEAFGVWQEWFLVHPDGISPSGKALFVSKGTSLRDPVGKLRSAESMAESGNGWTSNAVSRTRRKALKAWGDDYQLGPGGGSGFDDRDLFHGGSCPLSVIDRAFRLPEPEDDLVFPAEGDARCGKLSEGDVRVEGTKQTKYGPKAVLSGDTYNALSKDGDAACEGLWDEAHVAFDGDEWTCDPGGDALKAVIAALNEHGYSVSVDGGLEDRFESSDEPFESFPDG